MATKYGVNATKRDNQTIPQLIGPGEVAGRLRVAYDEYALSADLAASDIIKLMILPGGARVHDVSVYFDDLDASGGTIDIGWAAGASGSEAADADGFMATVDVTSAGSQQMSGDQGTRPGLFKQFAESVQVQIFINGDTDATSGSIKLAVFYSVD